MTFSASFTVASPEACGVKQQNTDPFLKEA